LSSFGVTKFNPEMSKHLETATAKIHGQNLDFVNLRCEEYNEDSRIPQIVFI
jgi:tRNA nucleotidyltransferase (CCA-adding enzyme)